MKKIHNHNTNIFIIMLSFVTLTFVLISSAFSWFLISKDVDINFDTPLHVDLKGGLEVSIDDGEFFASSFALDCELPDVLDVSGDGINLFTPTAFTGIDNDIPVSYASATPIILTGDYTSDTPVYNASNGDYIELPLTFRSRQALSVYLSSSSFIRPKNTSGNTSSYGSFSKDYIAGAVRAAFLEEVSDGVYENLLTWIPNPDYHLTYTSAQYTATFSQNDSGNREASYPYVQSFEDDTITMGAFETYLETQRKVLIADAPSGDDSDQMESRILVTLTKANENDDYYTGSILVRIWIEGYDRESMIPLAGGNVSISLSFNAIGKVKNDTWESSIDTIDGATVTAQSISGTTLTLTGAGSLSTEDLYYKVEDSSGNVSSEWVKYSQAAPTYTSGYHYYFIYMDDEESLYVDSDVARILYEAA